MRRAGQSWLRLYSGSVKALWRCCSGPLIQAVLLIILINYAVWHDLQVQPPAQGFLGASRRFLTLVAWTRGPWFYNNFYFYFISSYKISSWKRRRRSFFLTRQNLNLIFTPYKGGSKTGFFTGDSAALCSTWSHFENRRWTKFWARCSKSPVYHPFNSKPRSDYLQFPISNLKIN